MIRSTGKTTNAAGGAIGLIELLIDSGYSSAIANGDPVTLSSGYVVACAEDGTPIGVLRGVKYVNSAGKITYAANHVASTAVGGPISWQGGTVSDIVAYVEPVENRTFLVDTADAAVAIADIGSVKRLKSTGTANAYGNTTGVIDMDATVSTETRLVRIMGLPNGAGAAGTIVEVEFVNSTTDA